SEFLVDWASRTTAISVQTKAGPFAFQIFDTPANLAIARSIFEGKTYPLVPFLKDVKTVVDIGANVGAASLFLAVQYPPASILAVEPGPEGHGLLTQTVAWFTIVASFDSGLSDRDGRVPLYLGKDDSVTNSVGVSSLNSDRSVTVTLRQAEDFFRAQ